MRSTSSSAGRQQSIAATGGRGIGPTAPAVINSWDAPRWACSEKKRTSPEVNREAASSCIAIGYSRECPRGDGTRNWRVSSAEERSAYATGGDDRGEGALSSEWTKAPMEGVEVAKVEEGTDDGGSGDERTRRWRGIAGRRRECYWKG
mmetsp:Transcript_46967/g.116301  ORF Transcript_46967/g.116301 Transcript_46967/m.116301 type:complete len:148 (-) Transcript_46967:67-510(-)